MKPYKLYACVAKTGQLLGYVKALDKFNAEIEGETLFGEEWFGSCYFVKSLSIE